MMRPADLKMVEYGDHVADRVKRRVQVGAFRSITFAIAAHVERYGVEARVGRRLHRALPACPCGRKAMAKDDGRAGALLYDM
jgi:hypothetical protein